jgi:hypothetical protein
MRMHLSFLQPHTESMLVLEEALEWVSETQFVSCVIASRFMHDFSLNLIVLSHS